MLKHDCKGIIIYISKSSIYHENNSQDLDHASVLVSGFRGIYI
jgi:hypothetical protein